MFTEEQPPDYSFPPIFDVYPNDFLEIESDANFDDDSFDSEGEKIKEAELLIDPLDLPCDILSEYDSFNSQDFSRGDVLFSPDNKDKVFNPGILSREKSVKIITRFTQEKKLAVSYASWLFEDFDPPFYELLVFKEVPNSMRLLLFSSENEEKVFKPGIYIFKFHCCFLSELSHPEISSGSTTTHSDISLSEYDSFIFDLSNDQCPPTDRSDYTHEEFADELAHIISPPEYDFFYFWDLPDPGEWIYSLNSRTHENLSSTTCVNLPVEDDHSPLVAYVVWIFLAYLTYPVIPPRLHSFGNEDTIFDPGVTINRFYSFKPGLSHRCGTVKKFNTHCSHLNECPMMIYGKNTPILDVPLFHFYPLDQLKYGGD
nr:hypothetical protein [Tanacetum cinerariifolium]